MYIVRPRQYTYVNFVKKGPNFVGSAVLAVIRRNDYEIGIQMTNFCRKVKFKMYAFFYTNYTLVNYSHN